MRKKFWIALALILLLALSGGVWGFFIEPNRLVVHQASIQINNWPKELSGLRIALIADIHTGAPFINSASRQRLYG